MHIYKVYADEWQCNERFKYIRKCKKLAMPYCKNFAVLKVLMKHKFQKDYKLKLKLCGNQTARKY